MQYKIIDESPWQILSNAMTIGPSSTGYQLQVAADGRNYTTLFTVGAGITRQITNLSSGSYFRMKGNVGEVTVNWVRSCNDGGGGGSTYTAGEYIRIDQDVISVTGITPDLYLTTADTQDFATQAYVNTAITSATQDFATEAYVDAAITSATQDFATQADITAATSPIEEHLSDVEYVTATALTELHDSILELSGATGNSNILAAITSQAEYEAISGDVQTGDLIQVYGVDFYGDNNLEYGLFQAEVDQGSSSISWERKDNSDSVLWAERFYPWMLDYDVNPIEINETGFLISTDDTAEGEAYNGIGFDIDGKPVITHIVPQYDEQTGEITGVTRDDVPIGPDEAKEQVIATALVDLDQRKVESQDVHSIVKLTQAEYDLIASPDPDTLYIIINNQ